MAFDAIGMSHLSTQYILIPVTATRAGVAYNPTGDPVQFAFIPGATAAPGNTDWVSGTWQTDTSSLLYPYLAQCLVGPSGTTTLGIGDYYIWLKVQDNPEIPVLIAGQLQVS